MHGGRPLLALAGLLLAPLVVSIPAAAAAPITTRVAVLDGVLRPAIARVAVGGTVTWANGGKRAHTIASDTRAWAAFVLRPRAEKSIRFGRAGTFPYRADGRVRGVVVVVAGAGGGGGGGAAGGGPGATPASRCCFAVTVTLSAKDLTKWFPTTEFDRSGTITESWTWEAHIVEGYEEEGKRWRVSPSLPGRLAHVDFRPKVRLENTVKGTLVYRPDRADRDSVSCDVAFLTAPRFAPTRTDVLSLSGPVPGGGKGSASSGEYFLKRRQVGKCRLGSSGSEVEAQTVRHSASEDQLAGFISTWPVGATVYDWPVVAPAGASAVLRAGRSLGWTFAYHAGHTGSEQDKGHATTFELKGRIELRYFPPGNLREELDKLRRL